MKATIALVPALNEEGRIGLTVRGLRSLESVTEVVVVDDGSTDATASEARAAGACCLSLPRNVGKGDALNAGVGLIRQRIVEGHAGVPDTLLLADGDLAATAAELQRLLHALEREGIDMAIADLPAQCGAAGFGIARGLAAAGLRHFTRKIMSEPLSGQRAVRWAALPALVPFAPRFGVEVAMTLSAAAVGLEVIEVEVALTHAATGRDPAGWLHRANQARNIATELIGHAQRRARSRRTRSQAM
ncbi:MAG: glycosyltransferase family 2 protein [Actinomycetota bacterium]